MGRLSGFRYRDVARRPRVFGFEYARQGSGRHEVWVNPEKLELVVLPRHPGELPEGTLRSILREAGIDVDDFLNR